MPRMKTTLEDVESLLEEFRMNSGRDLVSVLQTRPRISLLLRLSMGLSLSELSSKIKSKPETLSQHERGKTKSMSKTLAAKLAKNFENNIMLNEEQIKKNFLRFQRLSFGGQEQAMKSAEMAKDTPQEARISKDLKKEEIQFQKHVSLLTSIGPINVDFLVELNDRKIIIETTKELNTKKLECLDLRAIKLKETFKNATTVVVLSDNATENHQKRLEDFDHIVKESEFDNFLGGF